MVLTELVADLICIEKNFLIYYSCTNFVKFEQQPKKKKKKKEVKIILPPYKKRSIWYSLCALLAKHNVKSLYIKVLFHVLPMSVPHWTWVASGDAPVREARPLTTMTHSVLRWWTLSKVNPPRPFKPHLRWGSLFVSSWKNILWVGGWIWTVTNCCRYGVKHLEDRGASECCGILPGQPYVRGRTGIGQMVRVRQTMWAERERRAARKTGGNRGYAATLLFMKREMNGDKSLWCLVPETLSWLHDSASLKTFNLVFSLSLTNLFTLRFRPTCESHSVAVSHRMIWCGFIKRRCVFSSDSMIASLWKQTVISTCYEEQRKISRRRKGQGTGGGVACF